VWRALLLLVLLAPGAAAWSVTLRAPPAAAAGLPYLVEACVDVPGELRLEPGRYAPFAGCGALVATGGSLTARLRPVGGAAKATARASVALLDTPLAEVAARGNLTLLDANGSELLRLPPPFVPLLPDAVAWRDDAGEHAMPPPDAPVLVAARGPPFSGALLRNDGAAPLRLAGRTLGGAPLPDATLAPGESVFLGAAAPPDARWIAWKAPRAGTWTLQAAQRVEGSLDATRPEKVGRTNVSAEPFALAGNVTLFATPDAGAAPVVALLDGARREVLLEGYTMTSPDVAAALARALARGVTVRALLDGSPVGGRPATEGGIVAALMARGADVSFLSGMRYATLHAKAIVVDRERALVSTDNFHVGSYPATPGAGDTRGFGVGLDDPAFAQRLAAMMDADMAAWPDVQPAEGAEPRDVTPGLAQEGPTFAAHASSATLAVSPDDGLDAVLGMLRGARSRVDVEILFADARFGNRTSPLLDALVDTARRNVSVRLLLDGRDDAARNAPVAEALGALAAREGLPLVARVDASGRVLHAKAIVADDAIYVGSMNWGRASATENREVGVILWNATEGAAWMRARMERDWAPPATKAVPGAPALLAPLLAVSLTWARGAARRGSRPWRGGPRPARSSCPGRG
jgi:phosphatidylserine/phosphatidylglycerophosphate/cardiolipin synthase-like enzyme